MSIEKNKTLLNFIFDQMIKLDKNEITVDEAKAQANLAKQVNNSLKYDLDVTNVNIKLHQYNKENGTEFKLID